ncbi:MAG: hypothetical protein WAL20_07095 [Rhodomicrobium sp.]|jgi:hypothetical protein
MADNPNATSANPNATMANPNAMMDSPSGSLVGHGKCQQQRSRNDNQQPFHAKPPLGDYGEQHYPPCAKLEFEHVNLHAPMEA